MNRTNRSIKQDYLKGESTLRPFYQYLPSSPDFAEIINAKGKESIRRDVLTQVIQDQYEGLTLYPATEKSLSKLAQENSFTVTTGHQLVFLGGPLFTTYKVVHTLKLAQVLQERFPHTPIVPIFWIHTEDHDFEEINHYFPDFATRCTYPGNFKGKVGQHRLQADIDTYLPEGLGPVLKAAYQEGRTWTDAYRRFMHELFGPYGILMLDADDPRLKQQFSQVIKKELQTGFSFHAVERRSQALTDAGYKAQISPREINLFYLKDELRNRIIKEGDTFKVMDTDISWSESVLLQLVEKQPEHFSPNVCLRPLFQEMILPNLAYIGGWGELSYWLQLGDLFSEAAVNFPLLLPRFSATLFRPAEAKAWTHLGLSLSQIESPISDLNRSLIPQFWTARELHEKVESIQQDFDALDQYISSFSPSLPKSVRGQSAKNQRFFARLEKKLQKIIRQQHAEFAELEKLKRQIQPDRLKQERILSLHAFPEMDPQNLVQQVYETCDPLNLNPAFVTLSF